MAHVKCVQKVALATPGSLYLSSCWTVRADNTRVELTPAGIELAPGTYELHWKFVGTPGDSITYTLDAIDPITGKPCSTDEQTIPHGRTFISSSEGAPPNYKAKTFQIK